MATVDNTMLVIMILLKELILPLGQDRKIYATNDIFAPMIIFEAECLTVRIIAIFIFLLQVKTRLIASQICPKC